MYFSHGRKDVGRHTAKLVAQPSLHYMNYGKTYIIITSSYRLTSSPYMSASTRMIPRN